MIVSSHRSRFVVVISVLSLLLFACQSRSDGERDGVENQVQDQATQDQASSEREEAERTSDDDDRVEERRHMVSTQIEQRGVEDERVLDAMRRVPRHRYVPEPMRPQAYQDSPLPIGLEQTISQPYIVALMSELLEVSPGHRVLEIGTGSGYQAAVLAEMGVNVFSIEILCELAERAERDLVATGYEDVEVHCGDGYKGWPEHAPFDRIIVTAAPPELPQALVDQLAVGGRLVVPVGEHQQVLQVVKKIDADTIETTDTAAVQFVPMVPGE